MHLTTALRLNETDSKPIIALIGAGGKSTLLFRLGNELAAAGKQTLLTSTTRLWTRQIDRAPFSVIGGDPFLLSQELPISLRGYRQVLTMAGAAPEPGKLRGLSPEAICRLSALADVDALVVEADGSRERPLKAPAGHEPVIPPCVTHVITVAGMAGVNQPLDQRWVHRPEIAAELIGLRLGDPLTPAAIARLLLHPAGGLKGHRAGRASFLYLNLAWDDAGLEDAADNRLAWAREIADLVLESPVAQPAYQAVLIGSAQAEDPVLEVHARVAGVVLAAGRANRLGGDVPKQILPWNSGNTLVGHVVDTALASCLLHNLFVVSGYRAEDIAEALVDRPVTLVPNPDWLAGQSSSVRAGVHALPSEVSAVMFLLADQPAVRSETIDLLVEAYRRTFAPIIVPEYQGGQRGNPVLFDRRTFAELLALQGDTGGRPVIDRYGLAVHVVSIDLPQPQGIETMEEYRQTRSQA